MVRKLRCRHCNYVWNYKGIQMYYTSCPRCKYNVNVKTQEVSADVQTTTRK